MNPIVKVQRQFFNHTKVIRHLDRKTARVLGRFGGTVRKTAQFLMRTKNRSARPGKPPYAHKKKLLKRLYFYSYDRQSKSVVVGPVLFKPHASKMIPRLMEKGGIGYRRLRDGGILPQKYKPHPYTAPAVAKTLPKMAQWWREL